MNGNETATIAAQTAPSERVDWVDYADLVSWISRADLCLGIFGTSEKAASVIPNKVYQVVAAGRPVCPRCGEGMDPEGHDCPADDRR